jgi:cell division protein FtsB
MHKQLGIGLLVGAIVCGASCASLQSQPLQGNAEKAARIALAQEFVRELEIIYRLQETAKKEFAEDSSGPGKLMTGIRVGSRTLFEMNDSINRLSMINVDARWAEFRDALKKLHQERIVLVHEMNQMSKTLLAGPEPDVNYGKLTARAPEITAQVEQIDKIIFTIAKAMFFALVDDARVGVDGKLHHLLLTKKDRTSMVQLIDKMFGPTLEDNNASRIVSAAWVIKYGLTRPNYKAADEL